MTSLDERLAVRKSRAHVRFVEDLTLALRETEASKTAIQEALQDQIGHARRLLEMAEAACYLASVGRLQPETRKQMEWALIVAVKAFRDLQEMIADWESRHGGVLECERDLAPVVTELDRRRAELALGSQQRQEEKGAAATFPQPGTAEWGQMNQRRAELIRKSIRGELSETEREEYETLQQMSLQAVEATFPRQGTGLPDDHSEANGE
jgi:hypothetical protein